MKEHLFVMGKWILAGILLGALAALALSGRARKRGTALYRWRMAILGTLIGLVGGVVVTTSTTSCIPIRTCYAPVPPPNEHIDPFAEEESPKQDPSSTTDIIAEPDVAPVTDPPADDPPEEKDPEPVDKPDQEKTGNKPKPDDEPMHMCYFF